MFSILSYLNTIYLIFKNLVLVGKSNIAYNAKLLIHMDKFEVIERDC